MSETKPRKVVGRSVAIGLAIVCVILIAGIGGALAYYTMKINDKDAEIASVSAQLAATTNNITKLMNEKSQLQTCLDENTTLLALTQDWLNDNVTLYETQITGAYSQITNLENQVANLNSQIQTLNSQIANLQAPKLIKVNLRADDSRPWLQTPYLHVYGEIVNVGSNTARNCKLHVVAYQGSVVAIDTYITMTNINGESWISVDSSVYYSGSSLTSSSITAQWTT